MKWLLVFSFAFIACGGAALPGVEIPDGFVSRADLAHAPSSGETVHDRCELVWATICERWVTCGFATGMAAAHCVEVSVSSCCSGSACAAIDTQSEAAVTLCTSDTQAASCDVVKAFAQQNILPSSSCDDLIRN